VVAILVLAAFSLFLPPFLFPSSPSVFFFLSLPPLARGDEKEDIRRRGKNLPFLPFSSLETLFIPLPR